MMKEIYIPLWSYSNAAARCSVPLPSAFTFHYGPIQIFSVIYNHIKEGDLHSTMVLFKLNHLCISSVRLYYLHSTMVLFKFDTELINDNNNENLHSTMVLFKW